MSTNKNLVQSVIPATIPYHYSTENTNIKQHCNIPLSSININTPVAVEETMTDDNISKTSSVHIDDENYKDTKLVITVPASDEDQSYELLNFTQAGCGSVINMLQHELGADPGVMANCPVISCVTTAIFQNHPRCVGNAQLSVIHPHHFPEQSNGSVYGDTPILCNARPHSCCHVLPTAIANASSPKD